MYRIIRWFLFLLNPERAHSWALGMLHFLCALPLGSSIFGALYRPRSNPIEVFGLTFDNPVGIAAGFDKNAEHVDVLTTLGFGFIEVGSITAQAATGNPQPRLFRLKEERGVINRMGLNNHGAEVSMARLAKIDRRVPIFVNVAKTADPTIEGAAGVEDYCTSVRLARDLADVIVVNISCPNSGDGRTFEDPDALNALLGGIRAELGQDGPPMVVKISPDLSQEQLEQVVSIAGQYDVAGFTATNTTIDRSSLKTSEERLNEIGAGGLSGAPLHSKAVEVVRQLRALTPLPIIGVGGIMGGVEAAAFLDAGASLVQVYSGFIYQGPGIISEISDTARDR